MITVTRLDRRPVALNSDRIVSIEACPDTTLRLVDGDAIVVLESTDEVLRRIVAFRASVLREAGLEALLAACAAGGSAASAAASAARAADDTLAGGRIPELEGALR